MMNMMIMTTMVMDLGTIEDGSLSLAIYLIRGVCSDAANGPWTKGTRSPFA